MDGTAATVGGRWLFSPAVDLSAFLGSAVLSLLLLAVGARAGVLAGETPDWAWVPAVLLVDVAHVWATGFRVYLDPAERARRPTLYLGLPVAAWVAGVALHAAGGLVFWRVLAYLAVFHFVRQQWGWVALYRARAGERDRLGRFVDAAAIHAATLHPLLLWHARLPRRFAWFVQGDFVALPGADVLARIAGPLAALALGAYAARSIAAWTRGRGNPGKDVVVATTAACWYAGIVVFDSDYAFTVTNVLIHGVPYFVLISWYMRTRSKAYDAGILHRIFRGRAWPLRFLGLLWAIAYAEELLWDRAVWHERPWLFGASWELESWRTFVVPLLAVPQVVHYVLDGVVWRRRTNPAFRLVGEP